MFCLPFHPVCTISFHCFLSMLPPLLFSHFFVRCLPPTLCASQSLCSALTFPLRYPFLLAALLDCICHAPLHFSDPVPVHATGWTPIHVTGILFSLSQHLIVIQLRGFPALKSEKKQYSHKLALPSLLCALHTVAHLRFYRVPKFIQYFSSLIPLFIFSFAVNVSKIDIYLVNML